MDNSEKYSQIKIPTISDSRGDLAIIEGNGIPFDIKRVYYLFNVPSESERGGHAHKALSQLIIPVSGSFELKLSVGGKQKSIVMSRPNYGLYIKPMVWREIVNFSGGAVCLVLASEMYDESDYIRCYEEYLTMYGAL